MADDLTALEGWVEPLLAKLGERERRQLAVAVARDLRRQQIGRIRSQQNPDGSPFVPRKNPARNARGAIRRKAQQGKDGAPLFRKLGSTRHLQARGDAAEAVVAIAARSQRIARVHQFGLRDHVTRGGPQYEYPARALLGLGDADRALVRELVLAHLKL